MERRLAILPGHCEKLEDVKVLNGYREEEKLKNRILRQLSCHEPKEMLGVLWLG